MGITENIVGSSNKDYDSIMKEINEQLREFSLIVDKQQMLALNAKIEASRAGLEGRGFSIVAQEFGAMAIKSKSLHKSLSESIENLSSLVGGSDENK